MSGPGCLCGHFESCPTCAPQSYTPEALEQKKRTADMMHKLSGDPTCSECHELINVEHDADPDHPLLCNGCAQLIVVRLVAENAKLRDEREALLAAQPFALQLRDERDLFASAGEAAELRIVQLREEYRLMSLVNGRLVERDAQLREELAAERQEVELKQAALNGSSATLARVAALPARWRAQWAEGIDLSPFVELEAALRGPK